MLKAFTKILLVLLVVSTSSCRIVDPPVPEQALSPNTTTITFAVPEAEEIVYTPLITTFNAEHPHIQVQIVTLIDNQPLEEVVQAADTALVPFSDVMQHSPRLIQDLAPLIDADRTFDRNDYFPAAFSVNAPSTIYVLPRTLFAPLWHYNADVWSDNNLPSPHGSWTWMDLFAMMSQAASRNSDTQRTAGWLDDSAGIIPLLGILESNTTLGGQLDAPDVAAALNQVAALIESGAIYQLYPTGTETVSQAEIHTLIREHQVLAWPSYHTPLTNAEPLPFELGAAVLPPVSGESLAVDGYILSSGSAHPDAAWQWLSFVSRQSLPLSEDGRQYTFPARQSLADAVISRYDPATTAVIRDLLQQQTHARAITPADLDMLRLALRSVLNGEQTAEQAAQEVALATTGAAAAPNPVGPTPTPFVVSTPQPTAIAGEIQIIFNSHGFGASGTAQLREIAQRFAERHPGINVVVTDRVRNDDRVGLPDVARGSDCFMWGGRAMRHERILLRDLQPLLDADATLPLNDYPSILLAPLQADGRLYGLPFGVSLRGIAYNPELFDAAGLAYPSSRWTAKDFFAAAEQLTNTKAASMPSYGFAMQGDSGDILLLLDLLDVALVTGDPNSPTLRYTQPDVVQALDTVVRFVQTATPHQRLTGYAQSVPYEQLQDLVDIEQVGMWFQFAPLEGDQFHHAPPMWGAGRPTTNDFWASALYITADSQHPEACWLWLSYISTESSLFTQTFPARRSVAESPDFRAGLDADEARLYDAYAPFFAQTTGVSATPNQRFFPPYERFWLYQAIDRAIQGAPLENELTHAETLTQQHMDCVHNGGAWGDCAFKVDPDFDGHLPPEGYQGG